MTLRLRLGEAPQWPSFSSLYNQRPLLRAACSRSRSLTQSVEFFPWCRADGVFTSGDGRCLRRCAPTQSLAPGPWGSNTPADVFTPALTYQPPDLGQSSFEPGLLHVRIVSRLACAFWLKTKNTKIVCVVENWQPPKWHSGGLRTSCCSSVWVQQPVSMVSTEFFLFTYIYVGFNCDRAPALGVCCLLYLTSASHYATYVHLSLSARLIASSSLQIVSREWCRRVYYARLSLSQSVLMTIESAWCCEQQNCLSVDMRTWRGFLFA